MVSYIQRFNEMIPNEIAIPAQSSSVRFSPSADGKQITEIHSQTLGRAQRTSGKRGSGVGGSSIYVLLSLVK